MTRDRETAGAEVEHDAVDIVERLDQLEDSMRQLRREHRREDRSTTRRPLGVPRPPTPRELLEFTDRHAIPATVAFLEANVRALEAAQAALRVARGGDEVRERATSVRERSTALSARTVDTLESALDDLARELRDGALPDDTVSRTILEDAQRLTDEIRSELAETRRGSRSREDAAAGSGESTTARSRIDVTEVETELDVLRDEFGPNSDDGPDEPDSDGGPDEPVTGAGGDEDSGSEDEA